MKVLILTASFGDGHNAAAFSLRDAINRLDPHGKVEVIDAFECYGRLNSLLKKGYQTVVRYAPSLWAKMFSCWDNPALFRRQTGFLGALRNHLARLLQQQQPDVVVSTYPVYGHMIGQLFDNPNANERPFAFLTVITDSISVCSAWFTAPSDLFIVPNEPTAQVLTRAGIAAEKIQALGFPVSPLFAEDSATRVRPPRPGEPFRILYVINTGKSKADFTLERLLCLPDVTLTITTGRNSRLKTQLSERLREHGDRVQVLGWTNEMPRLLLSHHLFIAKAGGAMVQEAIAACCPAIINQVIPGQEEGNAQLIQMIGGGAVAKTHEEVLSLVRRILSGQAGEWNQWRKNLEQVNRPDSALRIAKLILNQDGNRVIASPRPDRHSYWPILAA